MQKITKRKDGRYSAMVSLGHDPKTGRLRRKTVYGKTKTEVREKVRELERSVARGEVSLSPESSMKVAEWAAVWLEEFVDSKSENTKRSYASMVRTHLNPSLGGLRLSKVTGLDCQRFVNEMGRNGLSPSTVKLNSVVAKSIFGKAMELGYIPSNPMDGVELPKSLDPEIKPLDEDGVAAFSKAAKDSPYENLYRFILLTGARISEAIAVDWESVGEDGIVISKQFPTLKSDERFIPTKNKKSRKVPLTAKLREVLESQRILQEEAQKDAGFKNRLGLVFTDRDGRRLAVLTVRRDFNKVAARAGYPETRIHDLRHTYATFALKAGVDPKTVSAILGHSSSAFTLDRYAFVTDDMLKKSADKLDATLSGLVD